MRENPVRSAIPMRQQLWPGLSIIAVMAAAGSLLPALAGESVTRPDLDDADRQRVEAITRLTGDFSKAQRFEAMQGGASTSTAAVSRDAFSAPSANLTFDLKTDFRLGNALFQKLWVSSPSSTLASDGLGPLYNARSCQSCHVRDGRGHAPESGDSDATSFFLRLARSPSSDAERQAIANREVLNFPDPVYGRQLQDQAIPGLAAEGKVTVSWTETPFTMADRTQVMLRKPAWGAGNLNYGPLHPATTLSPRVAQPMIGLGLIEAIHEDDLVANAAAQAKAGGGISGRLAMVRDHRTGKTVPGRFGWKAQNATVRDQSSDAFVHDIGISTPDMPAHQGDCTAAQTQCLGRPDGVQRHLGDSEAPAPVLDLVTFYASHLAVPARRSVDDPAVLQGKAGFYEAGCVTCHRPAYVTRRDAAEPAHAFQLIWPWSDFLLHDMGKELADGQQVGDAGGSEWRTPPLWGIGLTKTVNSNTSFLHDGRARNLTEAILWHGGEAAKARDAFAAMPATRREALLAFLESL